MGLLCVWQVGPLLAQTPTPTSTPYPTPVIDPTPPPPPTATPSITPPCSDPFTHLSETFDDVTPPTLPIGWSATNDQGPAPLWVTTNSGVPTPPAYSLPNAAFVDNPDVTSDKRLDSPPINFFLGGPGSAWLFFSHNFYLQAGEDGGVLEVSRNGEAFQDVIAAGGSFITGGYNATIYTHLGSIIAGRRAWSGSRGLITTIVNLPRDESTLVLRWRMVSDAMRGAQGWWIDNVLVTECAEAPPPTPSPPPTPTPTVNISGIISYCANPVPGPVPNVTMTVTGTMSSSTLSDGSGNYTLSGLTSGGSYTVTPTKAARIPGSAGISTVDVIATQRHFLVIGTPLSGCRLTAADVNGVSGVNTVDVVAIQRFFLGMTTGTANVGKYQFSPASRTYPGIGSNQTGQNYDTLIFGDVASPFAE